MGVEVVDELLHQVEREAVGVLGISVSISILPSRSAVPKQSPSVSY